jgi:hypothetical protein
LSAGASPIGTIRFRVFGPQPSAPSSCLAGGRVVGATTSVSGNRAYHPSASFTPTAAGTYWWYTSYSGDPGDNAATSLCAASMAKTKVVTPAPMLSNFKQTHPRWRVVAPGRCTVTLTATNANHATSLPKKLSFTIVR